MQCWVKIEGARHDAENIVYGPRIMKNTDSNGLDAETPLPSTSASCGGNYVYVACCENEMQII